MRIKKYILSKTASKTAKENNLIIKREGKVIRLFDFSMLDTIPIPESEKEVLKYNALQNICAYNKLSFYGKTFNNFDACEGIAKFYRHRIDSKDGKHLYDIYQLAKIKHASKQRNSIYDNYNVITYEENCGYEMPIDIEI